MATEGDLLAESQTYFVEGGKSQIYGTGPNDGAENKTKLIKVPMF